MALFIIDQNHMDENIWNCSSLSMSHLDKQILLQIWMCKTDIREIMDFNELLDDF